MKKTKTLIGASLALLMIAALPSLAAAQTSTSTATSTPSGGTYTVTSTTTSSTATSTSTSTSSTTNWTTTNGTVQQQLVILQTRVVVLFGQLVAQITSQASTNTDPNLQTAVRSLQLGWMSMAQNQISLLRLAFQI